MQKAFAVGDGNVADARLEQDLRAGDAGRSCPADDRAQVAEGATGELCGVFERCEYDDRRTVLVVVEDGDVELLLEPVLDLEAARGRDVLEVDPAEGGRDREYSSDRKSVV